MTFLDNGDGTGTLSGAPALGTAGTYALTFTAANGVLPNDTQPFTLTVVEDVTPPAISRPTPGSGSGNSALIPLSITDASPFTVTVTSAPAGLVSASLTGSGSSRTLTLTPLTAGTATP